MIQILNDCSEKETAEAFISKEIERVTCELREAARLCGRSALRAVNPLRWFRRHPGSATLIAGVGVAGGALIAQRAMRYWREPRPDSPEIHVHFGKTEKNPNALAARLGSVLFSAAITKMSHWVDSRIAMGISRRSAQSCDLPEPAADEVCL